MILDYLGQLTDPQLTPERRGELIFFGLIMLALIGTLGYMMLKPAKRLLRLVTYKLRFLSLFFAFVSIKKLWGKLKMLAKERRRAKARKILEDYITDGLSDCIHQGVLTYAEAKEEGLKMAKQFGLWGLAPSRYHPPVSAESLDELKERIILEKANRVPGKSGLTKLDEVFEDNFSEDFDRKLQLG